MFREERSSLRVLGWILNILKSIETHLEATFCFQVRFRFRPDSDMTTIELNVTRYLRAALWTSRLHWIQ